MKSLHSTHQIHKSSKRSLNQKNWTTHKFEYIQHTPNPQTRTPSGKQRIKQVPTVPDPTRPAPVVPAALCWVKQSANGLIGANLPSQRASKIALKATNTHPEPATVRLAFRVSALCKVEDALTRQHHMTEDTFFFTNWRWKNCRWFWRWSAIFDFDVYWKVRFLIGGNYFGFLRVFKSVSVSIWKITHSVLKMSPLFSFLETLESQSRFHISQIAHELILHYISIKSRIKKFILYIWKLKKYVDWINITTVQKANGFYIQHLYFI